MLFLRSEDGDLFKLEARHSPAATPPTGPRPSRVAARALILLGAGALGVWWHESQSLRPEGSGQPIPTAPRSSPECHLPEDIERLGMRFRKLGPGSFLMGTELTTLDDVHRYLDEGMVHEVSLSPFCMQATEVTQAQPGSRPPRGQRFLDRRQPIIDALNDRARARLFRLPTEAEWEFAARAGSRTRYSFGDDPGKLAEYGNCHGQSRRGRWHTLPAASLAPNPWGIYDLYGNVAEWVEDQYGIYSPLAVRDPHHNPSLATGLEDHVLRGGSWDNEAARCRSANRDHAQAAYVNERVGFRLVRILGNP